MHGTKASSDPCAPIEHGNRGARQQVVKRLSPQEDDPNERGYAKEQQRWNQRQPTADALPACRLAPSTDIRRRRRTRITTDRPP